MVSSAPPFRKRGDIMIDIRTIFLPDTDYILIVVACYSIVFIAAYERFNSLVKEYSSFSTPGTARPWTTYFRYHAAAAVYSSFYVILFALIYQLFFRYPVLIETIKEGFDFGPKTKSLVDKLGDDLKLLGPMLTVILLTWGFEQINRTAKIDRKVRSFLHKLGSIPGAVSSLVRKMRRFPLNSEFEKCLKKFPDYLKKEVALLRNDENSIEHLFERVCHLYIHLEEWESLTSDFYHYHAAYRHSFEGIKVSFEKVGHNAERYYQLKSKFRKDAQLYAQLAEAKPELKLENMQPRLITELKGYLREDLKQLLESIYIYIACAVYSIGKSENKRNHLLQTMGFERPDPNKSKRVGIDPNDLTIVFMFLLIVIPLAAIFAYFISGGQFFIENAYTYVVWTMMAMAVGLLSVVVPTLCKQARETLNSGFWKFIRPRHGEHAWFSYLLSSSLVGVASFVVLTLLCYLTPNLPSYELYSVARRIMPWALVPFAVAFMLCFHLDRKTTPKYNSLGEGLTTSLAAVIAGIVALVLSSNILTWEELVKRMHFSISAAALLGFIIGSVFPKRYRLKAAKPMELKTKLVDMKAIIDRCISKFKDRAENENIQIVKDVASGITKLKLDPDRIEQALTSLISNAIEFTPQGGRITVSAKIAGKNAIRLSVSDSGIGMSKKQIDAVVNAPKERLDGAWRDGEDRPEADLYQIRSIAEEHGGRFDLKSTQLAGTEVMIELPEKLAVAETTADPAKRPDEGVQVNHRQVTAADGLAFHGTPESNTVSAGMNV